MRLPVSLYPLLVLIATASLCSAKPPYLDPVAGLPQCIGVGAADIKSWTTVKDKKPLTLHDLKHNEGIYFSDYKGTYDDKGWKVTAMTMFTPQAIKFHLGPSGSKYNLFKLTLTGERDGVWYWMNGNGYECAIPGHDYANIIRVEVLQFDYRVAHNH